MIIQFGKGDVSAYGAWDMGFISQPHFKMVLDNGFGFYILNAFEYNLFPKFYCTFEKTHWVFGFRLAGWTLEVMWNEAFAK